MIGRALCFHFLSGAQAGLFSAVATAFLIDSYKLLQPDTSSAYMSTALYLLVMHDNATSTISLPPPPPLVTTASTMSKAVNWLWFTSLLLSLSVALLGILIKQWIVEYNSRNTASAESPDRWAARHHMFFHAMISWPVADLVSVLPVMLHASLFLFFGGVALFLWNLDLAIGLWVAVLGFVLAGFYMACSLLPLWIPDCPTSTPLIHLVRRYFFALQIITLQLCVYLCSRMAQLHASACRVVSLLHPGLASSVTSRDSLINGDRSGPALASDTETSLISPLNRSGDIGHSDTIPHLTAMISHLRAQQTRSLVADVVEQRRDALTADGLLWLMFSIADSDARAVGIQALGAVYPCSALAEHLRRDRRLTRIALDDLHTRSKREGGPVEQARIVRSMLWSRGNSTTPDKATDVDLWLSRYFHDSDYPDMLFLGAVMHTVRKKAGEIPPPPQQPSASISTTVLLFLRARHLDFTDLLTALLWCDFGDFRSDDWTFVLERIVLEGSTRTSLLLMPCSSRLVCIADVLAQCVIHNAADKNNITVHRVLVALLETIGKRPYRIADISMSSFLISYIASNSFAEQQPHSDALRNMMKNLLIHARYLATAHLPAMETYFTLLSGLLPLILRQQREVPSGTSRDCASVLDRYNRRDRVQSAQVLSLTLRRILIPTDRQPSLSLWDMLCDTDGSDRLVHSLALTLCLAECKGEDVSAMVDTFLSHLSLQKLFEMHKAQIDTWIYNCGPPPHFLRWVTPIIQKCADLRPAWWFESLSALREDNWADAELQQYRSELEATPLYRGPCGFCHRLPLGWEDDDDSPSSCGFSPAPPGVSKVPLSMSIPDAHTPWHCFLCDSS